MLVLSAPAGQLADRIGPRLPMTIGPLGIAAGLALLSRVHAEATYVGTVLPGVLVFGLGLSLTVAPLTATVLAAAADEIRRCCVWRQQCDLARRRSPRRCGDSRAHWSHRPCLSRPGCLREGLSRGDAHQRRAGGSGRILAWFLIRNDVPGRADACPAARLDRRHYCAVDGTPLATERDATKATRPVA